MKRTSLTVLALLFANSKAMRVSKAADGMDNAVADEPEKIHVLDLGMRTMANDPKEFPEQAFPNIRTAFYA